MGANERKLYGAIAIIGGAALFVWAALSSAFSRPHTGGGWIYDYQTLIGGALAFIGAAATVFLLVRQLTETRQQAREQINVMDGQLTVMKQQLEVVRQQFYISRRPWMAVDGMIRTMKPLMFTEEGAEAEIDISFRNGGASVARGVNLTVFLRVEPLPIPNQSMPLEHLSAMMKGMVSDASPESVLMMGRFAGRLVLPSDPYGPRRFLATVKRSQFVLNPGTSTVTAWMPVCLGYLDEFGEPHATSFVVQYYALGGNHRFDPTGVVDGEFRVFGGSEHAY